MSQHNALTVVEPVLAKSRGAQIMSKFKAHLGRLELTSTRLVFFRASKFWLMFGALGMILGARSGGTRAIDVELSRIAGIARGKHGFNKKVLELTLSDGTTHRLSVDRYDELVARLREQLAARSRVEPAGEDRWRVSA